MTREGDAVEKATLRRSLDCLGTDILYLIFDELQYTESGSVWEHPFLEHRLVSKAWNRLSIIFIYRTVNLTAHLINRQPLDRASNRTRRKVWADMRAHTRHIVIRNPLNWNWAIKLLSECKYLDSIRYDFPNTNLSYGFDFPKALTNAFRTKWHHVRLSIYDYYFRSPNHEFIPHSNTVSLSFCCSNRSWNEPVIHNLLASCTRLETLQIAAPLRQGGFSFSADTASRLPPLQKLYLSQYHWNHLPHDVLHIWDFSRLQSLTLYGDPDGLRPFLISMPGPSLPQLKKFALSTWQPISDPTVGNWTAPIGLNFLLRNFIAHLSTKLEKLQLDVQDPAYLLPAIVNHARTLKVLEFIGATPGHKYKKPLSVKNLKTIQQQLPRLRRLQLNLTVPEEHHMAIAKVLPPFPRLDSMQLAVNMESRGQEYVEQAVDANRAYMLSRRSENQTESAEGVGGSSDIENDPNRNLYIYFNLYWERGGVSFPSYVPRPS